MLCHFGNLRFLLIILKRQDELGQTNHLTITPNKSARKLNKIIASKI